MGEQQVTSLPVPERAHFFDLLLRDLQVLERMLDEGLIEQDIIRIGAEQELFLVDQAGRPSPTATEILARTDDPHITTELARFNLEINLDPLVFEGACLSRLEGQIHEKLAVVRGIAQEVGAAPILVGILPSLRHTDLTLEHMTPSKRYHALNDRMMQLRGRPYELQIRGLDEIQLRHNSVMLEACNTSFQVHLQVSPSRFASFYNIAQALAAPVLAAAANAPLLFGRRLWQETRIAVFQQSIDTRQEQQHVRDSFPRVMFGTRWLDASVLELYREDAVRFENILGLVEPEDPAEQLEQGVAPRLRALQIHNGTVYRWNRACYGVTEGKPHLRIENRVLPSGPTPADEVANAAFWLGLMIGMSAKYPDVTQHLTFEDAKSNFFSAARNGLDAELHWFDGDVVPVRDLICDTLIPLAHEGLAQMAIAPKDQKHYLNIIEQRVKSRQTGANWLLKTLDQQRGTQPPARYMCALVNTLRERQRGGQPVHTWTTTDMEHPAPHPQPHYTVERFMTTDLFTVNEQDPIGKAAAIMEWNNVRHIPVEDEQLNLVGILSVKSLLKRFLRQQVGGNHQDGRVADYMVPDPITATPDMFIAEAIKIMRTHNIGALPVVNQRRLVGIVTERDFMELAAQLL